MRNIVDRFKHCLRLLINKPDVVGVFLSCKLNERTFIGFQHILHESLGKCFVIIGNMISEPVAIGVNDEFKLCFFFLKDKRYILSFISAKIKYTAVCHCTLVNEQHIGGNAEIVADLRKGVNIILKTVRKLFADISDIIGNTGTVKLAAYGICTDKH